MNASYNLGGGMVLPALARPRAARPASGSALIVALWIISLLSLVICAFAFDMHLQSRITSYYRKRAKAEFLARSGIEKATFLLVKSQDVKRNPTEEDETAAWYGDAKRLSEGLNVVDSVEHLGPGEFKLSIVPEPALRNINKLTEADWERMLEVGGVPEEQRDSLIECFFDWIDPDNDTRSFGAESEDYYKTLDPPYRARNAPLDTVNELLLIKGFTTEILDGGVPPGAPEGTPAMSGIANMLTTIGDGKVNVNAASERVLMTLPGVDEVTAQAIIVEREGDPEQVDQGDTSYHGVADFCARFPALKKDLENLIITDSQVYRITSVANVQGVTWGIAAIASFANGQLTILRWEEQANP